MAMLREMKPLGGRVQVMELEGRWMLREAAQATLATRLFDQNALYLATAPGDRDDVALRAAVTALPSRKERNVAVLRAQQIGLLQARFPRGFGFTSTDAMSRFQPELAQPIPDGRVPDAKLASDAANREPLPDKGLKTI
jgi:hypothetical protein